MYLSLYLLFSQDNFYTLFSKCPPFQFHFVSFAHRCGYCVCSVLNYVVDYSCCILLKNITFIGHRDFTFCQHVLKYGVNISLIGQLLYGTT